MLTQVSVLFGKEAYVSGLQIRRAKAWDNVGKKIELAVCTLDYATQ